MEVIPGEHFTYSNLGGALLGHALSLQAQQAYTDMIKTEITSPLGMTDTVLTLSTEQKERLAQGYDGSERISFERTAAPHQGE